MQQNCSNYFTGQRGPRCITLNPGLIRCDSSTQHPAFQYSAIWILNLSPYANTPLSLRWFFQYDHGIYTALPKDSTAILCPKFRKWHLFALCIIAPLVFRVVDKGFNLPTAQNDVDFPCLSYHSSTFWVRRLPFTVLKEAITKLGG